MVKVAFLLFSTTVIPSLISCTIVKQLIKHGESRKQCVHLHLSLCRYTALLCHRTTEQRSLEGTYRHRPVQPLLQAGCSGPRPGRFWLSPNSTSPLGNLWQPLTTLPLNKKQKKTNKKNVPLTSMWNCAHHPATGHHWAEPGSVVFTPSPSGVHAHG